MCIRDSSYINFDKHCTFSLICAMETYNYQNCVKMNFPSLKHIVPKSAQAVSWPRKLQGVVWISIWSLHRRRIQTELMFCLVRCMMDLSGTQDQRKKYNLFLIKKKTYWKRVLTFCLSTTVFDLLICYNHKNIYTLYILSVCANTHMRYDDFNTCMYTWGYT